MRIHFRPIKDVAALPAHWFLRLTARLPPKARGALFAALGLAGKGYYFLPRSHVRRTVGDLCKVIGHSDPASVYFRLVDNVLAAAREFGQVLVRGPEGVAKRVEMDPGFERACAEARKAGAILVVPHCAGSALSAAGFGKRYPCVLLVRESKSARRSALLRRYLERLGPDLIFVRGTHPMAVTRRVLRALAQRKLVIGTTDLARRTPDTVDAQVFGRRVPLPAWPARFAARRDALILPGYVHMDGGRIRLMGGEPYREKDLAASTQRWAGFFEECIRRYPSDWLFMFDKRWSRVLRSAASGGQTREPRS